MNKKPRRSAQFWICVACSALALAFGLFWLFRWIIGPEVIDNPVLTAAVSFVSVALGSLLVWTMEFWVLVIVMIYLALYCRFSETKGKGY